MFKAYIKFALRSLFKNKFYTFINIFGLAIGIALFILIAMYVKNELSYDKFNENYENLYRLEADDWCVFPPGLAPVLAARIPELENYVRFQFYGEYLAKYKENDFAISNAAYADSSYTKLFSTTFIAGDGKKALTDPNSVAITEKLAKTIFGDEDPLGKIININNRFNAQVNAIIKDGDNFHLKFDALFSMTTLEGWRGKDYVSDLYSSNFPFYYLLPENADIEGIYDKIKEMNREIYGEDAVEDFVLQLRPFSSIYFFKDAQFEGGAIHGNKQTVNVFIAIGIFIILIACINFINLSTARATSRAKEVGLKKVIGSYKAQLIRQFLTEAIIISLISFLIALTLVQLALPNFNYVLDKNFEYSQIFSATSISLMILGVIVIGFISGIYPAFYLTAFKPVEVMKGESTTGSKAAVFRKFLIVFQFAISIILIIGTFTVYNQIVYMKNKDLGFNKEEVLYFNCNAEILQNQQVKNSFKNKLLQNPNIEFASYCQGVPGDQGNEQSIEIDGEDKQFTIMPVDPDFFDVMDIEILEGRTFNWDQPTDELSTVIINETAVKHIGWDSIVGKKIATGIDGFSAVGQNITVIGVMKDFHMRSLQHPVPPLIISWKNEWCWRICMKVNTQNLPQTIDHIEKTWKEFSPEYPFKYSFLDDTFNKEYKTEERLAEIFMYFAILAIFIASLGLFGLASFMAQQRTKEIGIRKVLGATSSSIINLLSKEFSILVIIANIIAWPLAYYAMNIWLQDFAFHIHLKAWFFIVAAIVAFIIAFVTVSTQSLRIANQNPVNSIKYE